MILADTSVWIDHLRKGDDRLRELLLANRILCHPLIVAEIALGSLKARGEVLGLLDSLPMLVEARTAETRFMIEDRRLFSRGIGLVDAALVAACLIAPGTRLWTRDQRLDAVASEIGISV